jgi:iron-sulfur cluster assembly protein/iron-sulfur cluster insertion protein
MISLTSRAARQIETLHAAQGGGPKRLRLFVETGGCSGLQYGMSFDLPKENDREIVSEGVNLLVDPASYEQLGEVSIDFDDGLHGKGFEIRNPRAKSTCGCGKSFS